MLLAAAPPAHALTYSIKSRAEHEALPIEWGYPFWERGTIGSGVDGYPGSTYPDHIGTDFYASPRVGTAVLAVADGVVTAVGDDGDRGRGVFVIVEHAAGIRSEYLHLDRGSVSVKSRQRVSRGTPLGLTGHTGDVRPRTVGNAHLHLAIFSGPHRTGVVWNARWLVDQAPIASAPPAALTPVFRFWSERYQGHFYTASAGERDQIRQRWPDIWAYEGQAYSALGGPAPGSVPLYRFWSARLNGHFYTADPSERDGVLARWADTWAYEGIAYYVYPLSTRIGNTRTVARFWSPSAQHHFYTASASERDEVIRRWSATWSFEGDSFRVPNV